jgi:tRNA A-37 threonylcarbamoyl transferase component Bud32
MGQPLQLGKYQVVRELGQGSMGIVYEGYDAEIDRRVALKTVRSSGFSAEQLAELIVRLRREARAIGRLHHTNIVALYELGEAPVPQADGSSSKTPYLAMEFVEGQELRTYFAQGERLAIPEVVRIVTELLGALEYAHSNGVVHRDIKPSNIIVTRNGTVKLADFGIARMEWTTRYTQAGWVIGTPSYMPPEQFRGENVDLRADLYATGVLLYELLTGRVPFEGEITTVMYKVLHEVPPAPSILNRELPPAFDAIVLRALAKEPEARYQSAAEFRQAIAAAAAGQIRAAEGTTIRAPAVSAPTRRVRYGLLAVVALAVVGAVLYFAWPRLTTSTDQARLTQQKAGAFAAQAALRSTLDRWQAERSQIGQHVVEARTVTDRVSEQVDAAKSDAERESARLALERARQKLATAEKAQLITEAHIFAARSVAAVQEQQTHAESALMQGDYAAAQSAFKSAQGEAQALISAVRSVDRALQAQQDLAARLDLARRTVTENSGNASLVLAEPIRGAEQASGMLDEGQSVAALQAIETANASIRRAMNQFLEYLVTQYAAIAQREMAAHKLDVAKAAVERGKSIRAIEQQYK